VTNFSTTSHPRLSTWWAVFDASTLPEASRGLFVTSHQRRVQLERPRRRGVGGVISIDVLGTVSSHYHGASGLLTDEGACCSTVGPVST